MATTRRRTLLVLMAGWCGAAVLAAPPVAADVDCQDLKTRAAAQSYFEGRPGDPDRLDSDLDGRACEGNDPATHGNWALLALGVLMAGGLLRFAVDEDRQRRRRTATAPVEEPVEEPVEAQVPVEVASSRAGRGRGGHVPGAEERAGLRCLQRLARRACPGPAPRAVRRTDVAARGPRSLAGHATSTGAGRPRCADRRPGAPGLGARGLRPALDRASEVLLLRGRAPQPSAPHGARRNALLVVRDVQPPRPAGLEARRRVDRPRDVTQPGVLIAGGKGGYSRTYDPASQVPAGRHRRERHPRR